METDLAYYRRRASEEGAAAEVAHHPKARAIHLDLKARYENRATAIALRLEDAKGHLVSAA